MYIIFSVKVTRLYQTAVTLQDRGLTDYLLIWTEILMRAAVLWTAVWQGELQEAAVHEHLSQTFCRTCSSDCSFRGEEWTGDIAACIRPHWSLWKWESTSDPLNGSCCSASVSAFPAPPTEMKVFSSSVLQHLTIFLCVQCLFFEDVSWKSLLEVDLLYKRALFIDHHNTHFAFLQLVKVY